jgi:amino acid transporter
MQLAAEKRLELVRGLGPWASGAIVVGTMIGTGIFLKPSEMAREGRFVSIVFAAWIVGAALSIFGALSYAELGAAIPESGGEYAYLRRGFGSIWGFLFGWMHSIVGRPSSTASIAAGMMRFLGFFLPAIAVPLFTIHVPAIGTWTKPYDFAFTWAQPLAVFWLLLVTGVNYLGVRLGGEVQVLLTTLKVISVALIIGVAFLLPASGAHPPDPVWPPSTDTGLMTAYVALHFSGAVPTAPGRTLRPCCTCRLFATIAVRPIATRRLDSTRPSGALGRRSTAREQTNCPRWPVRQPRRGRLHRQHHP